jgi:hypothetical protein
MLYQLSYASPSRPETSLPNPETQQNKSKTHRTDTLPLRTLNGTEVKVSTGLRREQTPRRPAAENPKSNRDPLPPALLATLLRPDAKHVAGPVGEVEATPARELKRRHNHPAALHPYRDFSRFQVGRVENHQRRGLARRARRLRPAQHKAPVDPGALEADILRPPVLKCPAENRCVKLPGLLNVRGRNSM